MKHRGSVMKSLSAALLIKLLHLLTLTAQWDRKYVSARRRPHSRFKRLKYSGSEGRSVKPFHSHFFIYLFFYFFQIGKSADRMVIFCHQVVFSVVSRSEAEWLFITPVRGKWIWSSWWWWAGPRPQQEGIWIYRNPLTIFTQSNSKTNKWFIHLKGYVCK